MIQSGKQSDRSIYKWVIRMQPTYTINNKMSYILGISAYYHDAAAALIKDGGDHSCRTRRTLYPNQERCIFSCKCNPLLFTASGNFIV